MGGGVVTGIAFGLINVPKISLGATDIKKVSLGDTLVWPAGGFGQAFFDTAGSTLFTIPDGVTHVHMMAVGGGGGGKRANNNPKGAGGAGGSCITVNNILVADIGLQIYVVVGAAGVGTSNDSNIGSGGRSGLYAGNISSAIRIAAGGGGGGRLNGGGGIAGVNDFNWDWEFQTLRGQLGGVGGTGTNAASGGGGAAGSRGPGGKGGDSTLAGSPGTIDSGGGGGAQNSASTGLAGNGGGFDPRNYLTPSFGAGGIAPGGNGGDGCGGSFGRGGGGSASGTGVNTGASGTQGCVWLRWGIGNEFT
jgi:hypothetical protein